MKRVILLVTGMFLGYSTLSAQTDIRIIRNNESHSVNDSVLIVNESVGGLHTIPLQAINTSGGSINVKVKRIDDVIIPHTGNYFCWGLCYGAQAAPIWTSPGTEAIVSQDTDKTFTADYDDSGRAGVEIIHYLFFNTSNANDTTSIWVEFNITPAGIAEVANKNIRISAPYPNPANNNVTISYNLNSEEQASLVIYNTLGQSVQTTSLNNSNSKVNLNVSGLPSGIYICKLEAQGSEPAFQKLIVTH